MTKEKAAYSTDSAEQPVEGTHLHLAELNSATAKTGGCWVVNAYRPAEDNREYVLKGKLSHGTTLVVTLVAADDRCQYCYYFSVHRKRAQLLSGSSILNRNDPC